MLFQKRTDFLAQITGVTLGQTVRVELTREFHIEAIYIAVKLTQNGAFATANPDTIGNILNRVSLNVNSGASTRNVVDCTGPGLLEYARQVDALDRLTGAAITTVAPGAKTLVYPIYCAHPQLEDPIKSTLLLPAPAYSSNPVLNLTISTQAQMDINAVPTFSLTGTITIDVYVMRRFVNIPNFPIYEWELAELTQYYTASGNAQRFELPIPGSYTGILFRDVLTGNTRGDISVGGFDGAGENRLQLLGVNFRRWKNAGLQFENDRSTIVGVGENRFAGSFYLDFLQDSVGEGTPDLGSVLDGNITVGSGARIELLQDIAGAANVRRGYVMHRIFGDLSKMKRSA